MATVHEIEPAARVRAKFLFSFLISEKNVLLADVIAKPGITATNLPNENIIKKGQKAIVSRLIFEKTWSKLYEKFVAIKMSMSEIGIIFLTLFLLYEMSAAPNIIRNMPM